MFSFKVGTYQNTVDLKEAAAARDRQQLRTSDLHQAERAKAFYKADTEKAAVHSRYLSSKSALDATFGPQISSAEATWNSGMPPNYYNLTLAGWDAAARAYAQPILMHTNN